MKRLANPGGYDGVERKNDFFACDLTTYSWTQMPCLGNAPSPRYFHSCCLYAGKLYLYGGYSGTERLADMYVYDFDTNHWSAIDCTAGDAPSGRSSLVAQVYEVSSIPASFSSLKLFVMNTNGCIFKLCCRTRFMFLVDTMARLFLTTFTSSDSSRSAYHRHLS